MYCGTPAWYYFNAVERNDATNGSYQRKHLLFCQTTGNYNINKHQKIKFKKLQFEWTVNINPQKVISRGIYSFRLDGSTFSTWRISVLFSCLSFQCLSLSYTFLSHAGLSCNFVKHLKKFSVYVYIFISNCRAWHK